MAHFYASAQGSRGETHRLGGKSSGVVVEAKGWHDGVRIYARYDDKTARNYYDIKVKTSSGEKHFATIDANGIAVLQGGQVVNL